MSRAPKVHPQPVVSQRRATVALGDRAGLHSTAIETLGALNHPSLNHDHGEHMVSMLGIILPGIQACSPYIARRKACEDQRSGATFRQHRPHQPVLRTGDCLLQDCDVR